MKGTYIFLADGFEDMEALVTLDVLRRGGVGVRTVSIHRDDTVTSAHRVSVTADLTFKEFKKEVLMEGTAPEDVMVFPGGMPGAKNLAEKEDLMDLMQRHFAEGGTVAAICAAPGLVASQLPGLEGRRFTCYDGFEGPMQAKGAGYVPEGTVTDGNLITGRGPAFALDFGFAVLCRIKGEETVRQVRKGMLLD